ncbi:MAG: glycosyltransferase family 4 protein [Thermodesulfovibrionales bacterium]|nr:glycosyltransferase family 4 protein [Thermodesulfovibrionales bacterium]
MKVAYISFGHVDVTLPLVKHLLKYVQADLFLVFAKNKKCESIIDFTGVDVAEGFLPADRVTRVVGNEIIDYMGSANNINVFVYRNLKSYGFKNILLSFQLAGLLKKSNYDCIHFSGNDLAQFWLSLFSRKIPKIHTIHDLISHSGEKNKWAERYNRHLLNSHAQIILHAKASAPRARDEKRIHIIYYGPLEVYRMWRHKGISENPHTILFFGRLSPYKGVEYLLEAIPLIKMKVPGLRVIIAGSGEMKFAGIDIVNDESVLLIQKRLDNNDLAGLIQKASLVVCPYTDATQSGVIMTAYAFNKPVVATAVGGIPEVVRDGETGMLVPPRDPQALAEAIIELLNDESKRSRMAEAIGLLSGQGEFSWDWIAQKTAAVYEAACESS